MTTIPWGLRSGGLAVCALLLAACSGSDNDDARGPGLQDGQGVLLDAAVSGVDYAGDRGSAGRTDAQGRFDFASGESLQFRLGDWLLGQAPGAPAVTLSALRLPQGQLPSAQRVENLARLLQGLDADRDPSTGIDLDARLARWLDAGLVAGLDAALAQSRADLGGNEQIAALLRRVHGDPAATLPEAEAALAHLNATQAALDAAGGRPNARPEILQLQAPAAGLLPGGSLTLSAAVRDAEQSTEALQWRWQQLSGPAVTLEDADTPNPTLRAPADAAPGVVRLQLRVSDSAGATAQQRLPIALRPSGDNSPPRVAGSLLTVVEDGQGELQLRPEDNESAPADLALRIVRPPSAGRATLSPDGLLRYRPDADFHGDDRVDVAVSDGLLERRATVTIRVTPQTDPLRVYLPAEQRAYGGEQLSLRVAASGGDAALSFRWARVHGPEDWLLEAGDDTATLTLPAALATRGEALYEVIVSDGAQSERAEVRVLGLPASSAGAPGEAPLAVAGPDQWVAAGQAVLLDGGASRDPEAAPLTYRWRQVDGPAVALQGADQAVARFTAPRQGEAQSLRFELETSDGSLSSTDTVQIFVAAVAQPPRLRIDGPDAVAGGTPVMLRAERLTADTGPIRWQQLAGPSLLLQPQGDSLRFVAPRTQAALTLRFAAESRNAQGLGRAEHVVQVLGTNPPPQIEDQFASVVSGATLDYEIQASDPGDTLRYALIEGPQNGRATLAGNRLRYTPNEGFVGQDTLRLRVRDSAGQGASATLSITVTAVNAAPAFDPLSLQTLDEDGSVDFSVSATDAEGEPLSFAAEPAGNGALQQLGPTEFRYTPAPNFAGEDSAWLSVSDGSNISRARQRFRVNPVDDLPPATPLALATDEDTPLAAELPQTDVDGETLRYTLRRDVASGSLTLEEDGTLAYAPAPDFAGSVDFELEVADAANTVAYTQPIEVRPVNDPPRIDAPALQIAVAGQELALTASASDVESPVESLQARWEGPGAVVFADPTQLNATLTAPEVQAQTDYALTLRVEDPDGGTAEAGVTLRVVPRAVLRVGAAKRDVAPSLAHIEGVDEDRLFVGAHRQRFNLGGFGIDPLQNFPDPIGAFGDQLTAPAEQPTLRVEGGDGSLLREERIWLRALALEQVDAAGTRQPPVLLLTLDAVGAGNIIQNALKAAVAAATGVPVERIVFGQSHSHAGPDLQGLWGGVPQDWIENTLYPRAAAAAAEALTQAEVATLSLRSLETGDYNNYRRPRLDARDTADEQLRLLQARTPDGRLLASLLQYSAHPTSINESPRVPHADYILGVVDALEEEGGVGLYFNGPIADASPSGSRPGCDPTDPYGDALRDYGRVHCRGEGMAAAGLDEPAVKTLAPELALRNATVYLPVTNPLFVGAGLIGAFNRYYDFVEAPVGLIPGVGGELQQGLYQLPQAAPYAVTPVTRITIGGAEQGLEIVTIPGEASDTFGRYIRGLAAPQAEVMLFGLTQNSFGYILPEEEFSYIDTSGNDGFTLPFTGYEEFVSLGPLTAPLLKLQGYNPLFDVAPGAETLPAYLRACADPLDPDCIVNDMGRRLDYTQRELAQRCLDDFNQPEFCALLNPDTPLRPLCDALGVDTQTCAALGDAQGEGPGAGPGADPQAFLRALELLAAGDPEGASDAVLAGLGQNAADNLAAYMQALGAASGRQLDPPGAKPAPVAHSPQPLRAGIAKAVLDVPIGTPLGGYLRPPVAGEYIPGAEAFASGDPSVFFDELVDFIPRMADACDPQDPASCPPLAPLPDELRAAHSPYATYSPPSRGVYDALVAKAVALHDGQDYLVLVKTDFIGMLDEVVQDVKAAVRERTGIDLGDGLLMSASHSHGGPGALANHSTRYFWLAMDVYQHEVYRKLIGQLSDVVVAALDPAQMREARIGHASAPEQRGLNGFRRGRLESYDEAALSALRRRLGVLRIDDVADNRPLAIVVNWAAHGIAFDVENLFFSGDVLGAVERETEALMGVPLAMLVQSVGGDVSPRGISNDNKLQRIESYGKRLAPQVAALANGIQQWQRQPDLRAVSQRVRLDRESLGYAAEEYPYPWGAGQCGNEIGVPFVGGGVRDIPGYGGSGAPEQIPYCLFSPPPDAIDLIDNGVAENGAFYPQDTILTAARIGDITLLLQPGEPLVEYGRRLLERAEGLGFAAPDTFVWGYSGDHIGYILPPEQQDWATLGGAESTTTFWGWLQGARFLDVSADLLTALRDNTAAPRDDFPLDYSLYRSLYEALPPAPRIPSLLLGQVVEQPADIARFAATRFVFEGGDPVVSTPRLRIEVQTGPGAWAVATRPNGEPMQGAAEAHLSYRFVSGRHLWTVEFEAPRDWPEGRYRFALDGQAAGFLGEEDYSVQSAGFAVTPAADLRLTELDAGQFALAYRPVPRNYRVVDAEVDGALAAPVRSLQRARVTDASGVRDIDNPGVFVDESQSPPQARLQLAAAPLALEVFDAWGNSGQWVAAGLPGSAEAGRGAGLIGALADLGAQTNPALTALLDSDPAAAAAHAQQALEDFGTALAEGAQGFDPTRPGETGLGTDGELDAVAAQALGTAREAAPVVLTGAQLPGWSVPAAHGVGYPYPSGAATSGAVLDAFGPGQVRDAHNGEILYPVPGSPGSRSAVPVEGIAAYRYDAAAGFVEIPVQVDERMPYFLANANSDFSTYSGTDPELSYVWDNGDDAHGWGQESWMMVDGPCERRYPPGVGPVPDPVRGLDADDEVVFMASDAGTLYTGLDFPADWQAVQMLRVHDPLRPDAERFVYVVLKPGGSSFNADSGYVDYQRAADADQWIDRRLFRDDDPEKLGSSNTGYGANLEGTVCVADLADYHGDDGQCEFDAAQGVYICPSSDRFPRDGITVHTPTYRFEASGRWMLRDLRVRPPEAAVTDPAQWQSRPDLLDRWKGRAFQQSPDSVISLVGFEDEQVNWEANSSLIGERCGPVRCIREVWGADSGTNVTKTESFYRDAISYHYRVRVHPIPPDGLYTSWDYNRSAMVPTAAERDAGVEPGRYYTMLRPQGVPIDGINDDLGNVDGYAPLPLAECIGDGGPQAPASNGRCPAFFDAADPSFNLPLAFDNWEQVSGKGDAGSLVYSFELVGLTSLANPLVVPYYRDDACLDDGTGDDPVARPWPGESYDWGGGRVRADYDAQAGRPLDYSNPPFADCLQRQGAHGSHGVHYFVTHDSDNAFTPLATTEIDARQWQYIVPSAQPRNLAEPYANNIRAPLQTTAIPLTPPPLLPLTASAQSCNVPAPAGLQALLGSLHEHSGYSDGDIGSTPADYFAAGAALGLDFMGSSEHSDNARLPLTANTDCLGPAFLDCLQLTPDGLRKWERTLEMADAAAQPGYMPFRGFEWTSDRFGHINVYFSQHDLNAKTGTGYALSMEDFWLWFGLPAAVGGGDDGLAVFNHPGREDDIHANSPIGDAAYAWNMLAYRPEADARMVGIEVFGKSSDAYDADNNAPEGGWYAYALSRGWHLGPIGSEDEHGRQWAQPERAKTVLLAADHSRAALKSAMAARRFYALAQGFNDLRLGFELRNPGGASWPMGSRVATPAGTTLQFSLRVDDPAGRLADYAVELVHADGSLSQRDGVRGNADLQLDYRPPEALADQEGWSFMRVRDLRNNAVVAMSAPIWYRAGTAYPDCPADPAPPPEPRR